MKKIIFLVMLQFFLLALSVVNALSVDSVFVDSVSPGEEGVIRLNLQNDGSRDVDFVSFSLKFLDSEIIPIGSSEAFVNEIKEDEDETFAFRFRVSNNLAAGTYTLPYSIKYEENNNIKEQNGVIGIVVSANPEIEIVVDSQNAIIGREERLNVRAINRGLADARFFYLFLESEDISILSENSEYIGSIDSDDFETSNFDVIYNEKFNSLKIVATYKDFNNNDKEIIKIVTIRANTLDEAIEKGILKKNNGFTYVGIILLLLLFGIVYRKIRKRKKRSN